VLAEVESGDGIGQIGGDHEAVFERLVGDWPKVPAIMAGMVGSSQGWHDAANVACPTTPNALADKVVRFETGSGRPVAIVPGLVTRSDDGHGDVIRGEETQIVGLIDRRPGFTGVCVLPGTHSKWVTIVDGVVTDFLTFLTGEIFQLLAHKSFLRHSLDDDGRDIADIPDFVAAVKRVAEDRTPFLSTVFSVRARHLLDGVAPGDNRAYLSGLIIGGEIAAAETSGRMTAGTLTIIGGRSLARAYDVALAALGHRTESFDGDALVLSGLVRLARTIGFLETTPNEH
jgi:2-dehydro-3-deoxygalactonokinase